MFDECVSCQKIGITCGGPKFVSMPADDLVAWCKARKAFLGLTNTRIAEVSNMAKGTIDGFFASSHSDFRYETIRPIVQVLVGGKWNDIPCPDPSTSERAQLEEKIRHLEAEIVHANERANLATEENIRMREHVRKTEEEYSKNISFIKSQLDSSNKLSKNRRIGLIVASTVLIFLLVLMIAALIVDRINGDVGFFWLDGLFRPGSTGASNILGGI